MAEAKKKRRVIKKAETVREKAAKKTETVPTPPRLRRAAGKALRPVSTARRLGKKEYHPIKLPDNKAGRFLTARRSFIPKFFREAWAELRQVTWPNRKETAKMSLAVFIFAITLGVVIAAVDYGLENLFQELLLN